MGASTGLIIALVAAASSYGAKKDAATPIRNLGRFLETYVGDCESDEPTFDKNACEAEAKSNRDRMSGKLFVLEVEAPVEQLSFAAWDENRRAFRLHLTPIFSERGLAISVGKPSRLNSDGMPIVRNVPVWVPLPKGTPEFAFRRDLERGKVRLELVLRPKRAWLMKSRDGMVRGADVDLVALRVYEARGDRVLAEQVN